MVVVVVGVIGSAGGLTRMVGSVGGGGDGGHCRNRSGSGGGGGGGGGKYHGYFVFEYVKYWRFCTGPAEIVWDTLQEGGVAPPYLVTRSPMPLLRCVLPPLSTSQELFFFLLLCHFLHNQCW